MVIKQIFIILNLCLIINAEKINRDISIEKKDIERKIQLRKLESNNWFVSFLISSTKLGVYICFAAFAIWILLIVMSFSENDKKKMNLKIFHIHIKNLKHFIFFKNMNNIQ